MARFVKHVPRLPPLLALLAILLTAAAPAPAGAAPVPKRSVAQGYVGMNISDGALDPRFPLEAQMRDMVHAGVESVAAQVAWSTMQPVQGAPVDYSRTDRLVLAAARLRLRVVPIVVFAPAWSWWVDNGLASPPRPDLYGRFVGDLARRYGPGGTFWASHRELSPMPIRTWQIWNEPGLPTFFAMNDWAHGYVQVLRAAHDALKAVDPRATVALGGLVNSSWIDLGSLYAAGARGLFDTVALHPYSRLVSNVLKIVRFNRTVMNRHGDRALPIVLTEAGWPPSDGFVPNRYGFEVRPRDMPGLIKAALPAFRDAHRRYGVSGFFWYTWATADRSRTYPFDYAGLRTITSPGTTRDKIGLAAFRTAALRLEGCRAKGATAAVCRR